MACFEKPNDPLGRLRVTCATCQRPVDRIWRDFNHYTREHVVAVECHGEKEMSAISLGELENGWQIVEAVAFKKALAAA